MKDDFFFETQRAVTKVRCCMLVFFAGIMLLVRIVLARYEILD